MTPGGEALYGFFQASEAACTNFNFSANSVDFNSDTLNVRIEFVSRFFI
jgi:hypothetical protein